jgi:hypothetical protein
VNNYVVTVKAQATVDFGEIAEEFAQMSSVEQSIFLQELFDALKHRCKDHHRYETQLLYMAKDMKEKNFKNMFYTINTLESFLTDEELCK